MKSVATDFCVHVFVGIHFQFSWRNTQEWNNISLFEELPVFQSSCTILHSHQECMSSSHGALEVPPKGPWRTLTLSEPVCDVNTLSLSWYKAHSEPFKPDTWGPFFKLPTSLTPSASSSPSPLSAPNRSQIFQSVSTANTPSIHLNDLPAGTSNLAPSNLPSSRVISLK